jgi:hypothetical protein
VTKCGGEGKFSSAECDSKEAESGIQYWQRRDICEVVGTSLILD